MKQLRDTGRAIRTHAHAHAAARRAARRLPLRWRGPAARAQARTGVDADLVLAVMAVENGERGRVVRAAEYAYVLGLNAVGRRDAAEWVSVGPAQVQLRHLGPAEPLARRMVRLATPDGAATACAAVIARECEALGIDPSSPDAWARGDWDAIGRAYSGPLATRFGEAVRMVWCGLRPQPVTALPDVQRTAAGVLVS